MTLRRRCATYLALPLSVFALSGCGGAAAREAGGEAHVCRYDRRPPLPDDIAQPERVILSRARVILRRAASRDRRSGLPQVLKGSPYRIEEIGTWTLSDKRAPGGRDRIIGAVVDIGLDRPHPVDGIVVAAGTGSPRGSANFRFSRHFGYVVHRAHLSARWLSSLSILIDVRRGLVAEVGPGTDSSVTGFVPLAGHCPIRQPPAGYD
jgi:hypothetical protein